VSRIQPPASACKGVVVEVVGQGSLLQARVRGLSGSMSQSGGLRGRIMGFSRSARRRMLHLVARLDSSQRFAFVTLTQRADVSALGWSESMRCMRAFRRRLVRAYPECSAIWRKELQKRGAIHWHLLVWGAPGLDHARVEGWWRDLTRQDDLCQVDVQELSGRAAMGYVAKYAAKLSDLEHGAYQAALDEGSTGRWWGVWARDRLPWAIRMVVTRELGGQRWWYGYKRLARRKWRGVNGHALSGFALFVGDPWQWLLALTCYSDGSA
jgi:hypothetical protein